MSRGPCRAACLCWRVLYGSTFPAGPAPRSLVCPPAATSPRPRQGVKRGQCAPLPLPPRLEGTSPRTSESAPTRVCTRDAARGVAFRSLGEGEMVRFPRLSARRVDEAQPMVKTTAICTGVVGLPEGGGSAVHGGASSPTFSLRVWPSCSSLIIFPLTPGDLAQRAEALRPVLAAVAWSMCGGGRAAGRRWSWHWAMATYAAVTGTGCGPRRT